MFLAFISKGQKSNSQKIRKKLSVINTNLKSLITQDALNLNNRHLSTSMERLSTGFRINSAKDDAAGLAISTRMDTQVRGLSMAIKNAHDGISVVNTAEGAMTEVTSMLQRIRELAIQAANDTNSEKDRRYIQDEVDQLIREIDRISETTQFNSMNILDGSWDRKVFQIGANKGQTMNISIGSMSSKVLGVAKSNAALAAEYYPPPDPILVGTTAEGTPSVPTTLALEFLNTSGEDTYTFTLTDSGSGISKAINGFSVDLTNGFSKQSFVDRINLALASAQTDTLITATTQMTSTGTSSLDITQATNFDKTQFSISLDGGAAVQVDIRQNLTSLPGVDSSSITQTNIIQVMQDELQRLFDDRITVSSANGSLTVNDEEGRRLKVSQGIGNGFLFGTDAVNCGPLIARETTRNNISVNWKENTLIVTNSAGAKTSLTGYEASANSQILLDIVLDEQVDGLYDPILLATSSTTALPTDPSATFTGITEQSELSIAFADRTGDGSSAEYSFKITNGQGDIYADLSSASGLDVFKTISNASIKDSVLSALSVGIANLAQTDSSFDTSEWDVSVNENHLLIKNVKGRAIAIESFSSSSGYMTVTPINEPGASNILADKNAYYSETRLKVNTGAFGLDYSAANTDRFTFTVDGVSNSANITINVNGSATNGGLTSGPQFASVIQTALRASDISVRDPNNGSAITAADLSDIRVTYDADSAELVLRDPAGRALGFGFDSSANSLCNTNLILLDSFVTGPPNKMYSVNLTSSVAQGDVYNSTAVTIDFSTSDIAFNLQVNGKYLDGESLSSGSALLSTNVINWNAEYPFGSSTLKTKLDDLMTTLNAVHPRDVFEYSFFGNTLTIFQRDGGEVILGGYVSGDSHRKLTAEISPAPGQGEKTSFIFQAHTVSQAATAQGTAALETTATLNLEGDDIYSLKLSDSLNTYSLENVTIDISNAKSVENFLQVLEESLFTSAIKPTMDLDGNITFTRKDGGKIILQEFTSATNRRGAWTPSPGQGDQVALDGKGVVQNEKFSYSSGMSASASDTKNTFVPIGDDANLAVLNISVSTQSDSELALKAVDYALDYVAAERSNLGAIQNRLTHTIDNLSNIVTNTQASRSKIRDTDYAKETTELTRTQIIQQAATAMLAQANQSPQMVLQLLQ
ncbi:MAG: hypothetical protein CBC42_05210 [Betaproteobacteria bacterium TMED82]|nr:MAG: hypothetical protein CBC42_05210 [Betaproteobacteria bacterium TMED82]|tara:strand:+ start:101089 stop:104559 length:3471 start_codon:yes stop_codon:yes gene_type:complete